MKKLIVILVILLVLLAGGGAAAWFFLLRKTEPVEAPPPPKPAPASYVVIEGMSVPLRTAEKPWSTLWMNLALEIPKAEDVGEIQNVMPRVRDAFVRDLQAHPIGQNGTWNEKDIDTMTERLGKQADKVLGPGKVSRVLIRNALKGQ